MIHGLWHQTLLLHRLSVFRRGLVWLKTCLIKNLCSMMQPQMIRLNRYLVELNSREEACSFRVVQKSEKVLIRIHYIAWNLAAP